MDDKYIYIIIPILIILIIEISQIRNQLTKINSTLNKIARHVGVDDKLFENIDAELKDLILQGKKIKAIKKYRLVSGVGLKEAKDYIDSLSEKI